MVDFVSCNKVFIFMKKNHFLFFFFLSLNLTAQDYSIFTEWFLHSITINGELQENIYSDDFNIFLTIDEESETILFEGNAICNSYFGSVSYSTFIQENVIETYLTNHTLAICDTTVEDLYEYDYFLLFLYNNPINNIALFNYSITGTGDDAILVLTNEVGNIATYGIQPRLSRSNLSLTETSVKFKENPVKQTIKLSIQSTLKTDFLYSIYSVTGKQLIKASILNESINVNYLDSGIYFLKIFSGESFQTLKFIKS